MRTRTLGLGLVVAMSVSSITWRALGDDEDARRGGAAALSALVHGGRLVEAEAHVFEVLFLADALRVYVYDVDGRPLSAEGVAGRADIALVRRDAGYPRRGNHQSTSSTLRFVAASPREGRLRDFLQGGHSLGDEQDLQGIRIDLHLSHLPGNDGSAECRVELARVSEQVLYVCPGACGLRFLDPGECRECHAPLERAREDGARTDAPGGADAPDGDGRRPPRRPPGRR